MFVKEEEEKERTKWEGGGGHEPFRYKNCVLFDGFGKERCRWQRRRNEFTADDQNEKGRTCLSIIAQNNGRLEVPGEGVQRPSEYHPPRSTFSQQHMHQRKFPDTSGTKGGS